MAEQVQLSQGPDAFPVHVFDVLGVDPIRFEKRIGGAVQVVEKRPVGAPITIMTLGASRLPTDTGEAVELAVEIVDGQQGAAFVALQLVCNDIATRRRVPPLETPWRNDRPFLNNTEMSAIAVTGSRWGSEFDDVHDGLGRVLGHVLTLRLLTDAEADFMQAHGWSALVQKAGTVDDLLDVERAGVIG